MTSNTIMIYGGYKKVAGEQTDYSMPAQKCTINENGTLTCTEQQPGFSFFAKLWLLSYILRS